MTKITVYDDTARILEERAKEENTTIAEILEEMLCELEEHTTYIPLGERRPE